MQFVHSDPNSLDLDVSWPIHLGSEVRGPRTKSLRPSFLTYVWRIVLKRSLIALNFIDVQQVVCQLNARVVLKPWTLVPPPHGDCQGQESRLGQPSFAQVRRASAFWANCSELRAKTSSSKGALGVKDPWNLWIANFPQTQSVTGCFCRLSAERGRPIAKSGGVLAAGNPAREH